MQPLTAPELQLRRSLKVQVLGLASLLRTMARQRSRLLFLAEGDTNTKFFHLMACHRKRKNLIQSLHVEGTEIVSDEGMAEALYQFYDQVLGTNFVRSQRFDLGLLGLPSVDLSGLETLFTEAKIWAVISELPSHKALGPDGFIGLFYKMAWPIIKGDIVSAFNAFWARDFRSFNLINDTFMILLKKTDQPVAIRDYRPISLIHSIGKLITKCLVRRLAQVLDSLVRPNQTAFIRSRCIHDNFQLVRLSCKAIHAKRVPCVLLKIDIAQAFDSVAWNFLLEVLEHLGFGRRWRDWVSCILSSASTKILLNGRPGRRICHARGLRQGDPLSPMLFVLIMEVLNHLVCWLDAQGFLAPIEVTLPFRVGLYADDVVMFVKPNVSDLLVLRAAVDLFGLASGLFANLDKSVATPIGCSDDDLELVRDTLSCKIQQFPCKYLGIPLSIFKLRKTDKQPLVDSVSAKIPLWKGKLLNLAGRTALARSTLSAIPIHMSIALCLSQWAVQ